MKLIKKIYLGIRKFFELILIIVTLPVSVLLGILISVLIKIEDGGSIFFVQKRVGKDCTVFNMLKFRTMIEIQNQPFYLTVENDRRITKVGKWLRKTRLDELPQLLHLIKGEMNLIGPRPVPFEIYEHYKNNIDGYDQRHTITPGITGWAQINLDYVNDLAGEKMKVSLDKHYIRNQSFVMDCEILLRTVIKLKYLL